VTPSRSQRILLLWMFRHFPTLPQQVLRGWQQNQIDTRCAEHKLVSVRHDKAFEVAPIIGTVGRHTLAQVQKFSMHRTPFGLSDCVIARWLGTRHHSRRWPRVGQLDWLLGLSENPGMGSSVCRRRRPHGLPFYFLSAFGAAPSLGSCRRPCQQYRPEEAGSLPRTGASGNPGTLHTRFTLGEIFWYSRTNCTPTKSLSA